MYVPGGEGLMWTAVFKLSACWGLRVYAYHSCFLYQSSSGGSHQFSLLARIVTSYSKQHGATRELEIPGSE